MIRKSDRISLEVNLMKDQEIVMIYYDNLLEDIDYLKRATYLLE